MRPGGVLPGGNLAPTGRRRSPPTIAGRHRLPPLAVVPIVTMRRWPARVPVAAPPTDASA
ncbi:MAG: hypothetical protein ACRYHA_19660 [Janthinobacterium lividum]